MRKMLAFTLLVSFAVSDKDLFSAFKTQGEAIERIQNRERSGAKNKFETDPDSMAGVTEMNVNLKRGKAAREKYFSSSETRFNRVRTNSFQELFSMMGGEEGKKQEGLDGSGLGENWAEDFKRQELSVRESNPVFGQYLIGNDAAMNFVYNAKNGRVVQNHRPIGNQKKDQIKKPPQNNPRNQPQRPQTAIGKRPVNKAKGPAQAQADALARIQAQAKLQAQALEQENNQSDDQENQGNQVDLLENLPNGETRPIKIIWEESFLKASIKSNQAQMFYDKIKEVIKKTDAFFKTYINSFRKNRQVTVPKGFHCVPSNNFHYYPLSKEKFAKDMTYDGDIVIFVIVSNEPNSSVLASAMPCAVFADNTASIGILNINIGMLFSSKDYRELSNGIKTVIHEVFHIIAFHDKILKGFQQKVEAKHPHLGYFKSIKNTPMIDEAHWHPVWLTNDIMNPYYFVDHLITIFSLEYVELANKNRFETRRQNLPPNPVLEAISNFQNFLNYKCQDNEPSKYPNFCSMSEANQNLNGFHCSPDFKFIQRCRTDTGLMLPNNCLERHAYEAGMCTDLVRPKNANAYEAFGPNSRCILSQSAGAICIEFKVKNDVVYFVDSEGDKECPSGKQADFIIERKGTSYSYDKVSCPNSKAFADAFSISSCPEDCNFHGDCIKGKCQCFRGYSESDNCKQMTDFADPAIFNAGFTPKGAKIL